MGHEFKLSFRNSREGLLPSLAERLAKTGRYEIEELLNEELKLRFSGVPRRPNWPEDVMLKTNETGLLVLFHAGNASQRASLVSDLREICGEEGEQIEVEEL